MNDANIYSKEFYATQKGKSYSSAVFIVPKILEIVQPKTVIDIGCGVGTWLSVFKKYGCQIMGLDGEYVDKKQLLLSSDEFKPTNLNKSILNNESQFSEFHTIDQEKHFDLAVSLEVAEHLDPSRAISFVHELTELSDAILFSAAVPLQGGHHHINEKEMTYWVDLFKNEGYVPISCIRPIFKDVRTMKELGEISGDYANNTLLYLNNTKLAKYNLPLNQYKDNFELLPFMNKYVHSDKFLKKCYYSIQPNIFVDKIVSLFKYIKSR